MRVYLENSKRSIDLGGKPLGQGGQGEVYVAPHDRRLVVKIWNALNRTKVAADRARALCRWLHRDRRISLPIELVLDGPSGSVIGFVMPRFPGVLLLAVFNPAAGQHQGITLTPMDRLSVAALLADCFDAIHAGSLLAPDGNEANFLVEQGWFGWQVYAIDCDSYEFEARDSTGQIRRFVTDVGKEEYLAPELQGQSNQPASHTVATDLFSLAVLIWLLLKGGAHPFAMRGNVPPLCDLIRVGYWPYGPVQPLPAGWHSVDAGIPWAAFPKDIRELFCRAFRDGHTDPLKRPHAGEWRDALTAWAKRERALASTAQRIVRGFQTLSAVRATTWLLGRLKRLPKFFGWTNGSQQTAVPHKKVVRIALIILLAALAIFAAAKERAKNKEPITAHPIVPEWGRKPKESEGESDRWRGTPKQWRELVDECEREGK